jgi:hypothetical protein
MLEQAFQIVSKPRLRKSLVQETSSGSGIGDLARLEIQTFWRAWHMLCLPCQLSSLHYATDICTAAGLESSKS